MAVRPVFMAVASPKGLAKHLLHATEQQEERDVQASYQGDPEPGRHRGSVPRVQSDMPVRVRDGLRLDPGRTPTQLELENLLAGLRADGDPIARAGRANGSNARRMHVLLVTVSPHISFSIARALAGTEAGRAMLDSVARGANADLMAHMEREFLGYTRRGAAGRLGEERGRVGRIEIPHYTTRETMDRRSAPMSHIENIVPNAVFPDSGFVGAMNLRRMHGRVGELDLVLNESLYRRLRALGADVRMDSGACVMSEVPEGLCRAMARRTNQATEWAQAYAARRGLGQIADLGPRLRYDLIKRGARMTQRTSHDAVGDRAAWQSEAAEFDFSPRDLVDGARGWSPPPLVGSMVEMASAVRRASVELWQGARQMAERALAAGHAPPSISRVADVQRLRQAVVQATSDMRAAARTLAPPPSQRASETLAHWRAAVRQKTAELGTAAAREAARRTGTELNAWATAYRLRPMLRAASAIVHWGATRAAGVDVRWLASAVRAAAEDVAKTVPAGTGAMAETFRALRAARLVGGVREMPIAARAAAVNAVGPPAELPIARRAREAKDMVPKPKPAASVVRTARFNPSSAAATLRSAGEQYGPPVPASLAITHRDRTQAKGLELIRVYARGGGAERVSFSEAVKQIATAMVKEYDRGLPETAEQRAIARTPDRPPLDIDRVAAWVERRLDKATSAHAEGGERALKAAEAAYVDRMKRPSDAPRAIQVAQPAQQCA